MVVGGGGACRSAVYALWKWLGASRIYLVNRLAGEVETIISAFGETGMSCEIIHVGSVEQARELQTPALVVGTVPDCEPREIGEVLARGITVEFLERGEKGVVHEMCYHPNLVTGFYRLCEASGWSVVPGTESMMRQGVVQQVLWCERPLVESAVEAAERAVRGALGGKGR